MGTPHAIRTGNDNWLTTGVAQRPKVVDKLVSRDEHPVLASFFLPHFRPLTGHPLLLGQRNRPQVVSFLGNWPGLAVHANMEAEGDSPVSSAAHPPHAVSS